MIKGLNYDTLENHTITENEWAEHAGQEVLAGKIREGIVFIDPVSKEPLGVYNSTKQQGFQTDKVTSFTVEGEQRYGIFSERQARETGTGYQDYIYTMN